MSQTFTEAEIAVMVAILKRASATGISTDHLQADLGAPSKAAASMRWYRLKAKLGIAKDADGSEDAAGAAAPPTTPSKRKKAAPKNESAKKPKIKKTPEVEVEEDAEVEVEVVTEDED